MKKQVKKKENVHHEGNCHCDQPLVSSTAQPVFANSNSVGECTDRNAIKSTNKNKSMKKKKSITDESVGNNSSSTTTTKSCDTDLEVDSPPRRAHRTSRRNDRNSGLLIGACPIDDRSSLSSVSGGSRGSGISPLVQDCRTSSRRHEKAALASFMMSSVDQECSSASATNRRLINAVLVDQNQFKPPQDITSNNSSMLLSQYNAGEVAAASLPSATDGLSPARQRLRLIEQRARSSFQHYQQGIHRERNSMPSLTTPQVFKPTPNHNAREEHGEAAHAQQELYNETNGTIHQENRSTKQSPNMKALQQQNIVLLPESTTEPTRLSSPTVLESSQSNGRIRSAPSQPGAFRCSGMNALVNHNSSCPNLLVSEDVVHAATEHVASVQGFVVTDEDEDEDGKNYNNDNSDHHASSSRLARSDEEGHDIQTIIPQAEIVDPDDKSKRHASPCCRPWFLILMVILALIVVPVVTIIARNILHPGGGNDDVFLNDNQNSEDSEVYQELEDHQDHYGNISRPNDASDSDMLAYVATNMCNEYTPGYGNSKLCTAEETLQRGGGGLNNWVAQAILQQMKTYHHNDVRELGDEYYDDSDGNDDNVEVGGNDDNVEVGGNDDNVEVGGNDDNVEVGGNDDNEDIFDQSPPPMPHYDIVLQNAGATQHELKANTNFTTYEAFLLMPIWHTPLLLISDMKGWEIMTILETLLEKIFSVHSNPEDSENCHCLYPYAAGLRFSVNASESFGQRVSNIEVQGDNATMWSPLRLHQSYVVLINYAGPSSTLDAYTSFLEMDSQLMQLHQPQQGETTLQNVTEQLAQIQQQYSDYGPRTFISMDNSRIEVESHDPLSLVLDYAWEQKVVMDPSPELYSTQSFVR